MTNACEKQIRKYVYVSKINKQIINITDIKGAFLLQQLKCIHKRVFNKSCIYFECEQYSQATTTTKGHKQFAFNLFLIKLYVFNFLWRIIHSYLGYVCAFVRVRVCTFASAAYTPQYFEMKGKEQIVGRIHGFIFSFSDCEKRIVHTHTLAHCLNCLNEWFARDWLALWHMNILQAGYGSNKRENRSDVAFMDLHYPTLFSPPIGLAVFVLLLSLLILCSVSVFITRTHKHTHARTKYLKPFLLLFDIIKWFCVRHYRNGILSFNYLRNFFSPVCVRLC